MSVEQPDRTELEIAGQVLDLVRHRVGREVEAEVTVERQTRALTRFANSYIHQNVGEGGVNVRLRLHLDGRTAARSTTVVNPSALADLVGGAVDACRLSPADPSWGGLTPPTPLVVPGNADPATLAATPGDRAQRVRAFIDAAGGLVTAGYCQTVAWSAAFANSAGQQVEATTTQAAMDGIARTGTSDGVARLGSARLADLDGARLGARAAAKARAGVDPVELPPGRYEVVLEPNAVCDVLTMLGFVGFDGKAYIDRQTFAEPGAAQFDPSVTLLEDPAGGASGLPFDVEGTPRRQVDLVRDGVTAGFVHDRRTAREAGAGSTGNAVPGGAAHGAQATNLHLLPAPAGDAATAGDDLVDPSAAPLVPQVERGLLVTDNWYTRVLDPRTLVITGLTRNGVWLIEDGRITQIGRAHV